MTKSGSRSSALYLVRLDSLMIDKDLSGSQGEMNSKALYNNIVSPQPASGGSGLKVVSGNDLPFPNER